MLGKENIAIIRQNQWSELHTFPALVKPMCWILVTFGVSHHNPLNQVFLWWHFHKDQELETEFRSAKIWVFMKVFLRRLCKRVTTSNSLTETLFISFFYSIFKQKYLVWVNQNICILSLKTLHWSIESVWGFHYCFLLLLASISKATVVPNNTQIFFL